MKYVKMLALAAVAAAALMAFVGAGTASATELTCTNPPGTKVVCPVGTEIHAVNEESVVLTTEFLNITCSSSTVGGKITNAGSPTETVKGSVETLTFTTCNCPVTVLKTGTLEVHTTKENEPNNNGTLTSSGAEVTVNCSTIFGTVHCIYTTNNTDLGDLTGSTTTGSTATIDTTAEIPRAATSSLCSSIAIWHAKYSVTTPDWLDVD
jgi:hypothetical protein